MPASVPKLVSVTLPVPIVNCCGCVNVLTDCPLSCAAVVNSSIFVLTVVSPRVSGLVELKYNLFTISAKCPASSLLLKSISPLVVSISTNQLPKLSVL